MNSILFNPINQASINGVIESNSNQAGDVPYYTGAFQLENQSNNFFAQSGSSPIVETVVEQELPDISQQGAGLEEIIVHNPENIVAWQGNGPNPHTGRTPPSLPNPNAKNIVIDIWDRHKKKILVGGGILTLGGIVLYASRNKKKKSKSKGLGGIKTESGTRIS